MKLTQGNLLYYLLCLNAFSITCFPLYYADAFTPGKSKIVFISDRDGRGDIYVMDEDGQNVRRLTFHLPDVRWPSWSPDGQNIVFSSTWDIQIRGQIYIMDSDGKNVRRLISSNSYDSTPKLSPDGQKIVFTSLQHFSDIYVMDIKGKNVNKLIKDGTPGQFPTWSPDGRKIVLVLIQIIEGGEKVHYDICLVDADGENIQRLTNWNIGIGANHPAWSPDGRKIAFDAVSGDNNADIYIMNSDGTSIQRLTDHPSSDVQPKWLDNQRIIFVSFRDGNGEIYVMDIDGNNLQNLTNNPAEDSEPDCWPGYFSVWSVSSKGKLTSTWGRIKQ